MKTIKMVTSVFIILTMCLFVFECTAQSAHLRLLALSKQNHTLAIVDVSTFKVIATVPVGEDPHEVIASADGKRAYVSIYGGGRLHTINVIDLAAQKRLPDIDTRPLLGPHGMTYVNNKLWFTAEGSKTIGSYDPSTDAIDWCMGTGQDRTHMIYVANDARKIYTTNVASGTVSVIEDTKMSFGNPPPPLGNAREKNMPPPPPGNMKQPLHNWQQTIIPVSKGSEGFDISADSTELWTASAEDGKVYIINLKTKKTEAVIDAKVNGANRLKFTPDGKQVFISSLASGNIIVYDAKTRKLVKQIDIGRSAAGILMQPGNQRVFIACTGNNYVAVIDLKTLTVVNKIDVGLEPDGLAWATQ